MELRDYITVLRKGWVLIVVLALVGVAAAAGFSLLKKPVYSASAQVFVSTETSGSASDLAQGNTFTQQRVLTYSNLVQTPIVLLPVISSLGLDMNADQLATMVSATAPTSTTLISITVQGTDPVQTVQQRLLRPQPILIQPGQHHLVGIEAELRAGVQIIALPPATQRRKIVSGRDRHCLSWPFGGRTKTVG